MRSRCPAFPAQRFRTRLRTLPGNWLVPLAFAVSTGGAAACFFRNAPFARRAQFHACSTGLRQSNGNRLFGRTRPVLAFPNMMHLLANKFSRLCRRRFSLACVLARSIDRLLLRHISFPAGAHYVVRSSLETLRPSRWTWLVSAPNHGHSLR